MGLVFAPALPLCLVMLSGRSKKQGYRHILQHLGIFYQAFVLQYNFLQQCYCIEGIAGESIHIEPFVRE